MIGPVVAALVTLAAARARAQEPVAPPAPTPDATARAVHELERENQALRDRVDSLEAEQELRGQQIDQLLPLSGRLSGYVDFGFFVVGGNGAGTRSDVGNLIFPEYAGIVPGSWVFLGDPLSTAVNSRGEPADTGVSRAFPVDTIDSGGVPTFLVNTLALGLEVDAGDAFTLSARVAFLPRAHAPERDAGLDDHIAVDLAYVRWQASWERADVRVFAGKAFSMLGIEYRTAEAPDRITVTPSLICRYTCGRPIGVQVRSDWLDRRLQANLGLSNGTHFVDAFAFHDELDENVFKTLAGRVAWRFPVGRGIELGASGAVGAQDEQPDESLVQWHYGLDLRIDWKAFLLEAEWVKGRAPGAGGPEVGDGPDVDCALAPCLRYRGAYGLLAWSASPRLLPYVRVDWRDALHRDGARFVYRSDGLRLTAGVRVRLSTYVAAKLELVSNHELGDLPSFDNDLVTSSLLISF